MEYINRMLQEHKELAERTENLYKGIKTLEDLTADELGLMYAQYYIMEIYKNILTDRIGLAVDLTDKKEK